MGTASSLRSLGLRSFKEGVANEFALPNSFDAIPHHSFHYNGYLRLSFFNVTSSLISLKQALFLILSVKRGNFAEKSGRSREEERLLKKTANGYQNSYHFSNCERQQNSYSIEQDRESQNAIFGVN